MTYGVADFDEPENGWNPDYFQSMYRDAVSVATRLAIEGKRARSLMTVALPQGTKERLKRHLDDLRAAIDTGDLSDRRKRILRSKLDGFEKEVENEKSNINSILVGVALVVAALNQGTGAVTGVEDAIIKLPDTVNAINILLGREKLRELEAGADAALLLGPPPKKALPAPTSTSNNSGYAGPNFDSDLDEEVPF